MNKRIPKRLKREPLVEAIWEIRFSSESESPVGQLLPGMIFQSLKEDYPQWVRLPAADIPRPVAENDPALRYIPTVRLEAKEAPFSIQVGERMVTLNCRRPYAGWTQFSRRINDLGRLLQTSDLIAQPERFSLKYIDLIELDLPPSLASLDMSVVIAGHSLASKAMHLRTEIREEPFVHILQVATPAEITLRDSRERIRGTLVDIDTVHPAMQGFWETLSERLEQAHVLSKGIFFNLLTDQAIERLEPEYEEGVEI